MRSRRNKLILLSLIFLATAWPSLSHSQSPAEEDVTIDAHAPHNSFPHFWEQMFGSGRAILTLREELSRRPSRRKKGHRLPIRSLPRHPAR